MRLGVQSVMGGADWRKSLEKVQIAEDLGYEIATTSESWGLAGLPWLTTLATNTTKIQIGSAILNCFSRTPASIAQEFATLDVLSNGRMVLGIGSSGDLVIEHFHGIPFEKPLRRLREYVEIFNIIQARQPLNYDGEIFKLDRGFRINYQDLPRNHIPVRIAALTPLSIRQTGAIADGVIPIHWPMHRFEVLRKQLEEGAAAAGRDGSRMTIAAATAVFIPNGRNDSAIWLASRQPLLRAIHRMGVFYWQMLSRSGFESEVEASKEAWAEKDFEGAASALTDEMVREIHVVGPLASAREQLQERAALGADLQVITMPEGEPVEVGKILEGLIR